MLAAMRRASSRGVPPRLTPNLSSLDHLVGKLLELRWHIKSKCRGGLEIDHEIEPLRPLYRQVTWGKIVREVKVASEPEALLALLKNPAYHFKRIGLEAGPLSQWLFSALAEAELPVVCVETRHMQAVLKAQINKTDRNDARGVAQMMRVGLYRPVHVKTLRSQKLRMLLTHRKLLQSKAIAIENDLRILYATSASRSEWSAR